MWLAGLQAQAPLARAPGRGTLSGIVIPADDTAPLEGVLIVLTPQDDPSRRAFSGVGGPSSAPLLRTHSNRMGEFQMQGVPAGLYSISAEREGYSRQERFQIGKGSRPEILLNILAGQRRENVIVTMIPASAITGTVYGAGGERLAAAVVNAYRVKFTPNGRRLVRIMSVLSHEAGEFRLFHLSAGNYIISGSYSEQAIHPWESIVELTPNLTKPGLGFSTSYFVDASMIRNTRLMNVSDGRETANVDIVFKEAAYSKLNIHLLPAPGSRAMPNSRVAVLPLGADLGAALDYQIRGSGINFSVDRIAHGDYVLVAMADFQDQYGETRTSIISDTVPMRIDDDTSVTIPVIEPVDLPGQIAPGAGIQTGTQVRLRRVDNDVTQTFSTDVDLAGRFTLADVGIGTYDVYVDGLPQTSYLREVSPSVETREIGRIRIDSGKTRYFDQNSLRWIGSSLSIALNRDSGTLIGNVTGAGKPVPGAFVVLVPGDPQARIREDRYLTTYSTAEGSFQIQGIPPGRYTAFAFERIEAEIFFDAEFNAEVIGLGRILNIFPGGKLTEELNFITVDELARYVR